jgi:hypothetical protein
MSAHSKEIPTTIETGDLIANEIPSGDINSSNTDFTLAHTPVTGTVWIALNGLVQSPGSGKDYTISGKDITFSKPPRTDSDLLVTYVRT